jgi:uncharacterized membrane protein YecN with MAPEG domain
MQECYTPLEKESDMAAHLLAPYAGLLALLYTWLSFRITGFRRRHKQALGDNGADAFQRAIRTQANFNEYVPLSLILLYLLAELTPNPVGIHLLASALLLGRLLHAYSLIVVEPKTGRYHVRMTSMIITFSVMAISAILLVAAGVIQYAVR